MLDDIRNHKQFADLTQVADRVFQRHQMMDVAAHVALLRQKRRARV